MTTPYRRPGTAPARSADDDKRDRWDDYVLAAMLVGFGGWRVVLAIADHEWFGTEATLAAIMTCLGLAMLIATRARR